jgi:hypothetical protein
MFYSGSLVDVTIACPEGSIRAHQMLLAAFSPYFQVLFASNPCKHPVVFLHGAQLTVVKALVDFVYQGTVTCSVVDVPGILELARSLQIRGLDQVQAPLPLAVTVGGNGYPCGRSHQTAPANHETPATGSASPRGLPAVGLSPAPPCGAVEQFDSSITWFVVSIHSMVHIHFEISVLKLARKKMEGTLLGWDCFVFVGVPGYIIQTYHEGS